MLPASWPSLPAPGRCLVVDSKEAVEAQQRHRISETAARDTEHERQAPTPAYLVGVRDQQRALVGAVVVQDVHHLHSRVSLARACGRQL